MVKIMHRGRQMSPRRALVAASALLAVGIIALGLAPPVLATSASLYWLVGSWGSRGAGDGQFGRLVKTISLDSPQSNVSLAASFRCTLAKGVYKWKLSATDLAGNVQSQLSVRRLIVS
jgi:hypothetical protein